MALSSYIGGWRSRQLFAAIAVCSTFSLAGCAGMGLPFTEAQSQAAFSTTAVPAAVVKPNISEGVASSDWASVSRAVAGIPADANPGTDYSWRNAETGSVGTVAAGAARKHSGSICRPFEMTVNDTRGVRGYRGEACSASDGWKLYDVVADDSTLL